MKALFWVYLTILEGAPLNHWYFLRSGILPYISASIIMQLLLFLWVRSLEQLKKEGEAGRRRLINTTRYGMFLLALVQSAVMAWGLAEVQGISFK